MIKSIVYYDEHQEKLFTKEETINDIRTLGSNNHFICDEYNNISKLLGTVKDNALTFRKNTHKIEKMLYDD